MKKYITCLLMISTLVISGCNEDKPKNTLTFSIAAEYPPFEYYEKGKVTGFDIELAQLIAQELGKKAIFEDMQFSTILAALNTNSVDAAISTLTITKEREKSFDFSDPYYTETLATVFPRDKPITPQTQLSQKKVGCLLGATTEIWLKKHAPDAEIISMDNSNQIIEALKAGHLDVALMDGIQGAIFSQKNPELSYAIIAKSDAGYGIALRKKSPLTSQINQALKTLKANGELQKLHQKWLKGPEWKT